MNALAAQMIILQSKKLTYNNTIKKYYNFIAYKKPSLNNINLFIKGFLYYLFNYKIMDMDDYDEH